MPAAKFRQVPVTPRATTLCPSHPGSLKAVIVKIVPEGQGGELEAALKLVNRAILAHLLSAREVVVPAAAHSGAV